MGQVNPTWSPDGRYLVVSEYLEEPGKNQLLRVSVEDGSVIILAEGNDRGADRKRFREPKVSPDGRHVLVTTGESREEIWRMTFSRGR